ncbi:hypothetical protein BFJ71_g15337 [Fusarium oxysporum]|nr:hypothetical protein BFJ71_g15337 [Fusarium oxysporum]
MSTLLLAPFNDSMRLGQGYNSFLQTPCLGNAVDISNAKYVESDDGKAPSQTVSYSARFVEKMSDIVYAMNISAGSSIRTGSVSVSGGGNNIDEIKFAESDLNAVISVKVVNQTRNLRDNISFNRIKNMDSARFHDIYGDTFISGFIEGGDLHGIISIRTIDATKKSEVKNKLRSQFNGANTEWAPSSSAVISEALRQAEVTVTVNWSGGGIIKPSDEEWTIEWLIRASSAFADNVAKCPQRTWAILTRYDTVEGFVNWAYDLSPKVTVRRYEGVQRYTSDLLDMYIEYKGNLLILNDAIRHTDRYEVSKDPRAVGMSIDSLIEARKHLRAEMNKIVGNIEILDKDPEKIHTLLGQNDITAPELWRVKLPFRKDPTGEAATKSVFESLLEGLPIQAELSKSLPPSAEKYPPLCDSYESLGQIEKSALADLTRERPEINKHFHLSRPIGSNSKGTYFNNVDFLKPSVYITAVKASTFRGCLNYLGIFYSNGLTVSHGCLRGQHDVFELELSPEEGEKIIAVVVETGEEQGVEDAEPRITKLALYTNRANKLVAEPPVKPKTETADKRTFSPVESISHEPFEGGSLVKGFWGFSQNGRVGLEDDGIWRLGVVWGKPPKA